MDWFEAKNSDEILTPAVLFYPQRIQRNIKEMINIAGSPDRLRPHIKTHKNPEICRMQMKAGIRKFKCATISEAKMLAEMFVPDVLVAYPLIGPVKKKLIDLSNWYPETTFSILIDNNHQLEEWNMQTENSLNVYIDLDVGMERTGIIPKKAYNLFKLIQESKFNFSGLHIYDGHIHNKSVRDREIAVSEYFREIDVLINKIKKETNREFEVICGGSITFPIHAEFQERQLSPGTTLLWDYGYSTNFPDLKFDIASSVMTRIVSRPGINKLCLDLGHKAVASEMGNFRVYFQQIPDAKMISHSEEHLVIESSDASRWQVGDVLFGFPWHICPTVALHEKAAVIIDNYFTEYWDIVSRNRIYQL